MTTLAAVGVRYAYPDGTVALDGVELTIPPGQRLAIVGRNGSGKSTLIRHFVGLLRPTTGAILHDGRDIVATRVAHLARTVGVAFQDPDRQIFARSVRAEVAFGPRTLGRRGAMLDEAVEAALLATGLEAEAGTNPYDLGYSRRKLLGLASVIAMGTPVVVLDEPTTGQDARGVKRVEAIVLELARTGRTVVAISHDMRFVAETFERVVVMRAGQVILDGIPGEVFGAANTELLASSFLEPPLAARIATRLGFTGVVTEAGLLSALAASR